MNPILEAIKERRSIRHYKPELPAREDLEAIAEAGLWAASGKNLQTVRIVIITNPGLREKLRVMNTRIGGWAEDFDPFYGAPALLLVLSDRSSYNYIYDGALAMGNMHLMASTLGLGSCWIHGRHRFAEDGRSSEDFLRERLGFPENLSLEAVLAIGLMPEDRPAPHTLDELDRTKIHLGKY